MTDDSTLLRRYASERSEDAFAELVRRHLDLVFSVALREVRGDFARAQDVTQEVFTALARKASVLHQRTTLVGWLHLSVHHAAANLKRSEQRRQRRELEASIMHESSHSSPASDDWERIKPMLNEVVGELKAVDRDALLLRFYEQRPFLEIGKVLRLSEDAVQKRVERALDKLRVGLVKRGITSTSVALAVILQNHAVVAAPAGLVGTITQGALTASSLGGGATVLFHLMSIGKIQLTVIAALVVAGITTITLQHRANDGLRDEIGALQRENRQIALLRGENQKDQAELESLRTERAENARLRSETETLKAKLAALAAASAKSSPSPAPMRPLEALHNVGNATPASALESLVWAKENLDLPTLSKLFAFTPDARKKLDEIFTKFPAEERTTHGISTPEQMLAFFFAGLAKPFSGLQINEQHQIDSDNVAIRATLQLRNGGTDKPDFVFHQSEDGWRWVMPVGLINELPNELQKLNPTGPDSK